ncbi:hypothetical protein NM688_g9207 [Phlebia brevispora]|uniref:Uncharacterized protein n=1 Tax=Phlebia brevispora TaxID=194682 RepID=A0ACC1RIC8_9APHY|nr:hypothetical protein NM688_g9207 [Phlebia brevispora]
MTASEHDLAPGSVADDEKKDFDDAYVQESPKLDTNGESVGADGARFFDPEGMSAVHRSLTRLSESLRSSRKRTHTADSGPANDLTHIHSHVSTFQHGTNTDGPDIDPEADSDNESDSTLTLTNVQKVCTRYAPS